MNSKYIDDNWKKLQEAIKSTSIVHSLNQAEGALKFLISDNDIDYFTRNYDARKNIDEIGTEQIKDIAIKKYIESIIKDINEPKTPLEKAVKKTYFKYENDPTVDENDLLQNLLKQCLSNHINTFTRDENARGDLDEYLKANNINLSEYVANSIAEKIVGDIIFKEENLNEQMHISNIYSHSNNIEMLRSQIISGTRIKREGTISLGKDLQACSSIGKIRKNQEDAVLLIRHPLNPEFKMMVVADGLGSLDAGAKASDMVVSEIQSWFETLDVSYFESLEGIGENLEQALNIISKRINVELSGRGASTFVGAIIGKEETVISNVGDSRAYMVEGASLQEITEEPSLIKDLNKQGITKNPGDVRIYKDENRVTQALGKETIKPNFYYMSNYFYDAILLFSDGVTDCLSDDELYAITRNTDRSRLAETIVRSALKPKITESGNIERQVNAGRDDTTAAVYLNEGLTLEPDLRRTEPQVPKSKRTIVRVIDGRLVEEVVEENDKPEEKGPKVEGPDIIFD